MLHSLLPHQHSPCIIASHLTSGGSLHIANQLSKYCTRKFAVPVRERFEYERRQGSRRSRGIGPCPSLCFLSLFSLRLCAVVHYSRCRLISVHGSTPCPALFASEIPCLDCLTCLFAVPVTLSYCFEFVLSPVGLTCT